MKYGPHDIDYKMNVQLQINPRSDNLGQKALQYG